MNTGTLGQTVLGLLPVVVGAAIGAIPTMIVERIRLRSMTRTRWDSTLHESCAKFAAAARRILDLAEQVELPVTRDEHQSIIANIRREHSHLQILMAEVRLLASAQVQMAARLVVRYTWGIHQAAAEGTEASAVRGRALAALFDFYREVRRQLKVPDADDLAPLNPPASS